MQLNSLKSQAFVLKGRLYTLTVLKLLDVDIKKIASQLDDLILKVPKMFNNVPIILDCTEVNERGFDLKACFLMMRERHIRPVALQGAEESLMAVAQTLDLGMIHASSTLDKMIEPAPQALAERNIVSIKSKLHIQPIRSGQQLVAKQGDLIVSASVSQGAELMAEGNIHVYGTLRGRALAGMGGDQSARIFCLNLEAELVSIAGIYRLRDTFETTLKGPCQIYLSGEHIQIEAL